MDFELGELFTHAARQVLPIAQTKGLVCLADCEGPPVVVRAPATELRQSLHALFCAAIDALDAGFVFFAAELGCDAPDGPCRLTIHAAGTGKPASADAIDRVIAALGLQPEAPPAGVKALARLARGRCPRTGAEMSFLAMPPDGMVFTFKLSLPRGAAGPSAGRAAADKGVPAQGARAWLLSDEPRWSQLLARRLQQLGWAVTAHDSAASAQRWLDRAHPKAHRPRLVLGLQSLAITLSGLEQLEARLPQAQFVLGMSLHGMGQVLGARGKVEVRAFPFSPADLIGLSAGALAHAQGEAVQPSGHTQPMPLAFEDRRRVLVVDDNPVNQLVACGMLQALGFEVDGALDGEEAIAHCRVRPPDAVLMDVHMPGLDGLETTRQLRALQRQGVLPLFPIIAATAGDSGASRRHCLEAGMDAYLGKPLNLSLLEAEVRRMLPLVPGA